MNLNLSRHFNTVCYLILKILKMPAFIPDVPYKIQFIFILTFSYVWSTAFIDDYEAPLPPEGDPERTAILVRISCI